MRDVNLLLNNGVNISKSLEILGDMEMYNETLVDFSNAVSRKLEDIKKYKELSDMTNYAILVHSLKSDARYLGFEKLAEISYQHEIESKNNNFQFVFENYDALMNEANKIVDLVNKYLGNNIQKEEITEVVEKDKTIIVVDDSDLIRNFIQKIFNDTYNVLIAHDGKEAIDVIELNTSKNIVGMLLDLNMPNFNGFEVLNYFRENHLFNKIPVSIITGDDSRDTIEKAFRYPIIDMLSKPFNEIDVKKIIEKTVALHQQNN